MDHAAARSILEAAWTAVTGRTPTHGEGDYAQAIAWLETGYGRVGQFAKLAAQGLYNWGALEAPRAGGECPPGTAPGSDAGNARCFYVYKSDEEAARALVRTLAVSFPARAKAILAAMNGGRPIDVARAMQTPPAYFEASADDYARALVGALDTIHKGGAHDGSIHPPSPAPGTTPPGAHGTTRARAPWLGLGLAAVAAIALSKLRRSQR